MCGKIDRFCADANSELGEVPDGSDGEVERAFRRAFWCVPRGKRSRSARATYFVSERSADFTAGRLSVLS